MLVSFIVTPAACALEKTASKLCVCAAVTTMVSSPDTGSLIASWVPTRMCRIKAGVAVCLPALTASCSTVERSKTKTLSVRIPFRTNVDSAFFILTAIRDVGAAVIKKDFDIAGL